MASGSNADAEAKVKAEEADLVRLHPAFPRSPKPCKKVADTDEPLFVENEVTTEKCPHSICYCGFPIHTPDGEVYGSLCVLDASPLHEVEAIKALVEKHRNIIEHDLRIIAHLNVVSEAAFNDELTGILNRRGFLLLAKQQIQVAIRQKQNIGLLFVDINDLKLINDQYGHHIGDVVIQSHAQQIRDSLRASELAARFGGDEFIVMVLVDNENELAAVQKRLEATINSHKLDNGITLKASIGKTFALASLDLDLSTLIAVADQAMYSNKNKQRLNA